MHIIVLICIILMNVLMQFILAKECYRMIFIHNLGVLGKHLILMKMVTIPNIFTSFSLDFGVKCDPDISE